MGEFRFANPEWLHACWGVLLLGGILVWLELRGRSLLDRFISPQMQERLVRQPKLFRRLLAIGLFCGSLLCLVLGLMRPQWGMTVQTMTRIDSQIMICLDVSKSMLAEDVVPNRLERAKAEIDSLLGLMDKGQQVGLIAFAGRASVLCPMTTDFGFLRLILGEVSPGSIGRGGTRIGEAIGKAADGFRSEGDVNRLILLITDGEDHDSFPLDAAEKAKEKGVRVVSIGFGDESGSKIAITDPATGAREFVKDRSGNDVVSRLDGDTLREIALSTEGVYIPAGTGALDLQSIYDAHIKSLMRGTDTGEERIIRNEGYQWFAIAALVLLLSSIALRAVQSAPSRSLATAALGFLLASCAMSTARAQTSVPAINSATDSTLPIQSGTAGQLGEADAATGESLDEAGSQPGGDPTTAEPTIKEIEQPPRELYNRGIRLISSNPDRAEKLLSAARTKAGVDGELRFRALYNLGWVEVTRGDRFVSDEPKEAIKYFELAAGRFREAIRLRPESDDARYNLEIIARRILELQDTIAQADDASLETELDALIVSQRAHQAELQELTALMAPGTIEPGELRSTFRKLGVTQRKIISDAEKIGQTAKREIDKLKSDPQSTNAAPSQAAAGLTPEQMEQMNAYREAQITAMLAYVDRGTQRMAKARSFTRRAQPQRAFARWSAALTESKRARDQLRNPIEVLGVLIQDASELQQLTQLMAQTSSPIVSLDTDSPLKENSDPAAFPGQEDQIINSLPPNAASPAWLTDELLRETQTAITERTAELTSILQAAVQGEESEQSDASEEDAMNADEPVAPATVGSGEDQQMLENIRSGLPFIVEAQTQFATAGAELQNEAYSQALFQQNQAIQSLTAASEFFYDLRRMIELILREEKELQMLCTVYGPESSIEDPLDAPTIRDLDVRAIRDSLPPAAFRQLLESATETQAKNQSRLKQLEKLISNEQSKLEAELQTQPGGSSSLSPPSSPNGQSPPGETPDQDPRLQRFEIADKLRSEIEVDFAASQAAFNSALERASEVDALNDEAEPANTSKEPSVESPQEEDESGAGADAKLVESELDPSTPSLTDELPRDAVDRSVDKLEELQRLFFSLIEHLRDTTKRQAELGDRTLGFLGDVSANPEADGNFAARISLRQERLNETATQIATALAEQAEQAGQASVPDTSGTPGTSAPTPQGNGQAADAKTLAQASQLVEEGVSAMNEARDGLERLKTAQESPNQAIADPSGTIEKQPAAPSTGSKDPAEPTPPEPADGAKQDEVSETVLDQTTDDSRALDSESQREEKLIQQRNTVEAEKRKSTIFQPQSIAFQKLLEALQLLDDQQSNDNSENQEQNDDQQEPDSQDSEQRQSPEPNESRDMNSAQMLQAIRDREAQRREDKNKSQAVSNGGVEKDW
ncbi:MAG: VWA domain-containing protein [Pirellulaceae bacterium]